MSGTAEPFMSPPAGNTRPLSLHLRPNSVCFESSPLAALSECDSFWPIQLGCWSQGLPESPLCVPEPASPPPGPESQNLRTQQSAGGSAPSTGREAGSGAQ